jgi:hypothetical protein
MSIGDEPRTGTSTTHPRALSRRGFLTLTAGTAAAMAVGTQGAHAAPAGGGVAGHGRPGRRSGAFAFLDAASRTYPDSNPGPRLAQSYADQLGLFSTAFVYDNALAVCAYLAGGRSRLADARALGDGLVYAMEHDPGYSDGRLRQAYNVGPYVFYDGTPQDHGLVLPDGSANIGWQFGFLGTAVGDMAWPGIALVQLYEATRDRTYLRAAVRIGEWITDRTWSTQPLGGFSLGVDGQDVSLPNGSTEHNIDCVSFFTQLRSATRDDRWRLASDHAYAFLGRMWNDVDGYFYTGTNDGVVINPEPLPLDPQTWSWLTLREDRYVESLDWAASALAVTDTAASPNSQVPEGVSVSGVTFSTGSLTSTASYNDLPVNPDGVWMEGTAQLATALADRDRCGKGWGRSRSRGRGGRAGGRTQVRALLAEVEVAQARLGVGQTMGGEPLPERSGIVAASSLIDSGFGFGYFQVQHVGATSWYVMADRRVNPMRRGGI